MRLIVLAAAPAWSQDDACATGSRCAGLSYALENFDDDGINFDNAGAADAFASYRFHPHFAAEARFQQTFEFKGDWAPTTSTSDIWTLTANAQYSS